MSNQLRTEILLHLELKARSAPHHYVDDVFLAEKTGIALDTVRRQMDILESLGYTRTANSHDGHAAMISPAGSLEVEPLEKELQRLAGQDKN